MPTDWWADYAAGVDYTGVTAWVVTTGYVIGNIRTGKAAGAYVRVVYTCIADHTSSADDEPGVGVNWATYWSITADGTMGKGYKTITDASRRAVAGDAVKCVEGPARTNISVNLTWTVNSLTVTAAADVTAEIAVKDFIGKQSAGAPGADETFWCVSVISYSNPTTTITLVAKYDGASGAAASCKLGIIDTGTAAAAATVVQDVITAGTAAAPITISGGWNKTTGNRTGETWFYQSGTSLYGYGLQINVNYIIVSDMGCLRYNIGLTGSGLRTAVTSVSLLAGGGSGITFTGDGAQITSARSTGVGTFCAFSTSGIGPVLSSCIASSSYYGFTAHAGRPRLHACITRQNEVGFYHNRTAFLAGCSSIRDVVGLSIPYTFSGYINNHTFTSCSTNIGGLSSVASDGLANVGMQRYGNTPGDHRAYHESGVSLRDTTNYRTVNADTECLSMTPSNAVNYMSSAGPLDDWFIAEAESGKSTTLSIYMKKSAGFNGDVQLEGYVNGKLTDGPTVASVTTSYAEYTLVIDTADIPETNPIIALRVKCRGTAGSIYLDDFSGTNA